MYEELKAKFEARFGRAAEFIFGAPGRTELGGNHTDHQHGMVLAGAVDREILAAVAMHSWEGGSAAPLARVYSEGYGEFTVELSDLEPKSSEYGTPMSLVRGMNAQFAQDGWLCPGFDAYVISQVPGGSGLSSSAAFEVLFGNIINTLSGADSTDVWRWGKCKGPDEDPEVTAIPTKFEGSCLKTGGESPAYTPQDIAIMGQKAENIFFGKPCGLMDQMASSLGNAVFIDFADPKEPKAEVLPFDFAKSGYKLCIIDCGADHADLTGEYAAITEELAKICSFFGKRWLRDVDENDFYAKLPELRALAGDRAVLRAMHVFTENKRAKRQAEALKKGDFERFLELHKWSGVSSWCLLQNIVPLGSREHQDLAFCYALSEKLLGGKGSTRVHGGGFAGTIQVFVPDDMAEGFCRSIDQVLGEGSAQIMNINPLGGGLREICQQ